MTEETNPMERRLVIRLLKYWRSLSDGERLPAQSNIDPHAIPDMWPNCAVLYVAGKEIDPEFSYVGTALSQAAGIELAGRKLSQTPADTLVSNGFSYFGQVLVKKVPITFGGEFVSPRGLKVLYRSIIMPLANDGERINGLLGAANCREVTQD
ncbi:MAG: PAS domain-containing protein [Alphaproteobacteria bacterium]